MGALKQSYNLLALVLCGLLLYPDYNAQASTEDDPFDQGIIYFGAGDYARAIKMFRLAESQGDKSVSLYYNLASAYFKQQQYDLSSIYFNRLLASPKMYWLARYNLGLIAIKQGRTRDARTIFEDVSVSANNKKLKSLASQKLREVKKLGDDWSVYSSINYGYDDNITASPTDSALGKSDTFYDLYLSIDKVLSGHRKKGWLVDASYFRIDFSDDGDFDEYLYSAGIRYEDKIKGWNTRGRISIDKNNFGGEDYQTSIKLDTTGKYRVSKGRELGLRYRYQDISSDWFVFDYLAGWRQRARIDYRLFERKSIYQFYYELELNDRGVLTTSEYSYDYSPTRHTLYARYTYLPDKLWDLIVDVSLRLSDYPASDSFNRDDDQFKLGFRLDYRIDKSWKIKSKLLYIDNESSVERYDYDKYILSIGMSKLF